MDNFNDQAKALLMTKDEQVDQSALEALRDCCSGAIYLPHGLAIRCGFSHVVIKPAHEFRPGGSPVAWGDSGASAYRSLRTGSAVRPAPASVDASPRCLSQEPNALRGLSADRVTERRRPF